MKQFIGLIILRLIAYSSAVFGGICAAQGRWIPFVAFILGTALLAISIIFIELDHRRK